MVCDSKQIPESLLSNGWFGKNLGKSIFPNCRKSIVLLAGQWSVELLNRNIVFLTVAELELSLSQSLGLNLDVFVLDVK